MDTTTLGFVIVGSLIAVVLLVGLRDVLRPRAGRQVSDAAVRRGLADNHRHTGGATPQGIGGAGDGAV